MFKPIHTVKWFLLARHTLWCFSLILLSTLSVYGETTEEPLPPCCSGMIGQFISAGDPVAGRDKAASCVACHGADGNSASGAFPSLAGQNVNYLIRQMQDIQSEVRPVPTMVGQLDGMSEQDLTDIAAWYASNASRPGLALEDEVALGERIYRVGIKKRGIVACTGCHAPNGKGNAPAGFPSLAGQFPEYIVQQLQLYQSGERHNDPEGIMRDVAAYMVPKEMSAVAQYIYGLHEEE